LPRSIALGAQATGLAANQRLETVALLNGFVTNFARSELASRAVASPDPARPWRGAPAELLASGRYRGSPPPSKAARRSTDLTEHFGTARRF
jgi:hypothetical protein